MNTLPFLAKDISSSYNNLLSIYDEAIIKNPKSLAKAISSLDCWAEQEEEIADFNLSEALAQRDYTPLVVAQIYKAIRYPNRAADKNQQGTVRIGVTINRSGKLVSAITTQESKYRLLNQAALKAVKKAAPFPELLEEMKADSFEVNLPITFRLQ